MQSPRISQPKQETMTFAEALKSLVDGNRVTKLEWNDPEIYLEMRAEKVHIHNQSGWHTLIVSEGDIIGNDYIIVPKKS